MLSQTYNHTATEMRMSGECQELLAHDIYKWQMIPSKAATIGTRAVLTTCDSQSYRAGTGVRLRFFATASVETSEGKPPYKIAPFTLSSASSPGNSGRTASIPGRPYEHR